MTTHPPARRRLSFASAVVLAATLIVVPAQAAAATTEDAIQLSWDGSNYAATTTETFVGLPVIVPGDQASRTLTVRNDGSAAGVLTATIDDVELLEASEPDSFYDDVMIEWDGGQASLAELDTNGETRIAETTLGEGETTTVTIGYDFPVEAESGNVSQSGERSGTFDVDLALEGQSPAAAGDPDGAEDPDPLPETGSSLTLWVGAAAAVLISLGLLALRVGRLRGPRHVDG